MIEPADLSPYLSKPAYYGGWSTKKRELSQSELRAVGPMTSPVQINAHPGVALLHSAGLPAAANSPAGNVRGLVPASNQNTTGALRVTYDPFAGVVLEYLNNNGTVQLQLPTAAAVAYLRAGLTAEGLNKPQSPVLSLRAIA